MKKVKQRISHKILKEFKIKDIFQLLSVSIIKIWKILEDQFDPICFGRVEVQDPCGPKRRLLKTQELNAA